ncbi:MAG: hypothetical protein KBB71_04405 [Lentimicrobiaceae bacterium]|nr:hypothetical protein [Lentimicrobiaceae bacterium]
MDHLPVRFRQSLFVVHIPAQRLEERIDVIDPGLVFFVRTLFVFVDVLKETLDQTGNFFTRSFLQIAHFILFICDQ